MRLSTTATAFIQLEQQRHAMVSQLRAAFDNMRLALATQSSAIGGDSYNDDDECEPAVTASIGVGSDGYVAAPPATYLSEAAIVAALSGSDSDVLERNNDHGSA